MTLYVRHSLLSAVVHHGAVLGAAGAEFWDDASAQGSASFKHIDTPPVNQNLSFWSPILLLLVSAKPSCIK